MEEYLQGSFFKLSNKDLFLKYLHRVITITHYTTIQTLPEAASQQ